MREVFIVFSAIFLMITFNYPSGDKREHSYFMIAIVFALLAIACGSKS
jgi:hypothetical protein